MKPPHEIGYIAAPLASARGNKKKARDSSAREIPLRD
jgi:hypothetical protein